MGTRLALTGDLRADKWPRVWEVAQPMNSVSPAGRLLFTALRRKQPPEGHWGLDSPFKAGGTGVSLGRAWASLGLGDCAGVSRCPEGWLVWLGWKG